MREIRTSGARRGEEPSPSGWALSYSTALLLLLVANPQSKTGYCSPVTDTSATPSASIRVPLWLMKTRGMFRTRGKSPPRAGRYSPAAPTAPPFLIS